MMLGFDDFSVFLAWFLMVLSTLGCLVYGIINWNKGEEVSELEAKEEQQWDAEEEHIQKELSGEVEE
ncbi:MAG: hypothetical protein PF447_07705 [Spirochaetaceae bacterium]|jgi:membrane protein YqaA with SNARE-associated domain|nr:hypothetical protein [Spirochaetaceae bacterium]